MFGNTIPISLSLRAGRPRRPTTRRKRALSVSRSLALSLSLSLSICALSLSLSLSFSLTHTHTHTHTHTQGGQASTCDDSQKTRLEWFRAALDAFAAEVRYRANLACIRQSRSYFGIGFRLSRPESSLGFQGQNLTLAFEVLGTFQDVPSLLGGGSFLTHDPRERVLY